MKRDIKFLSCKAGVSKKGSHYCVCHYAMIDNSNQYIAVQSFINDPDLEKKLSSLKPLDDYQANIVFANNQNILVDILN